MNPGYKPESNPKYTYNLVAYFLNKKEPVIFPMTTPDKSRLFDMILSEEYDWLQTIGGQFININKIMHFHIELILKEEE
jgi:hypothetical protein